MPVIYYKTLDIDILCAQARRIECCHCFKSFSYIHGENVSGRSTGLPVVSSDNKMGEAALRRALEGIPKLAEKEFIGKGLCPYCKRYQDWMVKASLQAWTITGFILGGLIGGILGAILSGAYNFFDGSLGTGAIVGGLGLATLGVVIGLLARIKGGPHRQRAHPESMTDKQLTEHLALCDEKELDPFKVWLLDTGMKPTEKMGFTSLGLLDLTGRPVFPQEWSTEQMMKDFEAA